MVEINAKHPVVQHFISSAIGGFIVAAMQWGVLNYRVERLEDGQRSMEVKHEKNMAELGLRLREQDVRVTTVERNVLNRLGEISQQLARIEERIGIRAETFWEPKIGG